MANTGVRILGKPPLPSLRECINMDVLFNFDRIQTP